MTIAEKLTTIAKNEQNVYGAGFSDGYSDGREDGKYAMSEAIFEGIQNGGTRTDYSSQFNNQYWTDETFSPKYSFAVASNGRAGYMFENSRIVDAAYIHGDKLDFSNYRNMLSCFHNSTVKRLKRIDARKTESGFNGMANMFLSCEQLETIEEFYPSTLTNFIATFSYCPNLIHCIFCSEIAVNGLDMSSCTKLDRASIFSIFDHMSDTTSGLTITISKAAVDAALYDEATQTPGSETYDWEVFYEGRRSNWTIKLV